MPLGQQNQNGAKSVPLKAQGHTRTEPFSYCKPGIQLTHVAHLKAPQARTARSRPLGLLTSTNSHNTILNASALDSLEVGPFPRAIPGMHPHSE